MRTIGIGILAAMVSVTSADALSRHETARLSCSQLQSILKSEGTAILRYRSARNPGVVLYDTYAAQSGMCRSGGRGRLSEVPAADTKSCKVIQCSNRKGGGR